MEDGREGEVGQVEEDISFIVVCLSNMVAQSFCLEPPIEERFLLNMYRENYYY